MTLDQLSDLFLYAGFVAVTYFTLRYGLASKWWRYAEGRALFAKSAALMLVAGFVASTLIFGDYPGRRVVRLVVYTTFCLCAWYLAIVLERRLRADRRERDALVAEYLEARHREGLVHVLPAEPVRVVVVHRNPVDYVRRTVLRWLRRG